MQNAQRTPLPSHGHTLLRQGGKSGQQKLGASDRGRRPDRLDRVVGAEQLAQADAVADGRAGALGVEAQGGQLAGHGRGHRTGQPVGDHVDLDPSVRAAFDVAHPAVFDEGHRGAAHRGHVIGLLDDDHDGDRGVGAGGQGGGRAR